MNTTVAYNDVDMSTEILNANSHRIIQILLEKTLSLLLTAKVAMENGNIDIKTKNIKRASEIITYLRSCLRYDSEDLKKFSEQLDTTYYIAEKCLINASLKDDIEYTEIAILVMQNVKSGWDQIA